MKKAIFTFLMLLTLQLSLAQVSFVGNPEYGQLQNFVYDKSIPNKVYATTYIDKHIMVSNDSGVTWSVFYTLPFPAWSPNILEMRLANNGTALSFIEHFGTGSPMNKVAVLDLQSLTIIKEFNFPANEGIASIDNYSLYEDGTMTTAAIFTKISGTSKFFTTTDGGATWTKVYDGVEHENVVLNDAVMDPQNPQKLFVVRNGGPGNTDGGLMISTDAGTTWTETLNGLILQSIAIDPQNNNIIYVGTGIRWSYADQHEAIYKSTDGGNTWTEQTGIIWDTTTSSGQKYIPKITINPYDNNHIVVLADDRVAVTTDAGTIWTTTPHNGLADGYSYTSGSGTGFNPNNLNQVLIANRRFAKNSLDRGITLTTIPNPFFRGMGSSNILKVNGEDQLIYGVQYGYTRKNLVTNQETPISVFPLGTFPIGQQIGLMFVDKKLPGRVYSYKSGFSGNSIMISDDYGVTQTPLYTTYDVAFSGAETDPSNPKIVWVSTFNGNNASLRRIDFTNLDDIRIKNMTLPYKNDVLQGIKINPNNSNEVLVTVGNQVLKSTNGGKNWTRITAGLDELVLPNIAINLAQNPLNANQYTIAASNGIYTSLDAGNTWSKIYTGLIQKVEHSTEQDGQIVGIGTSYLDTLPKVVYTNNGGANWEERTANNYYNSLVISGATRFVNANTAEVYLTTNSLGILKDVITFATLEIPEAGISKDDISIYPNPAVDIVNVKSNGKDFKYKMTIYNVAGQQVMSAENKTSLDISQLPKGVYLLKLDRDNMKTVVKKIIKK